MKEYRFNDLTSLSWAIEDYVRDMEQEYERKIVKLQTEVELLEDEIESMLEED